MFIQTNSEKHQIRRKTRSVGGNFLRERSNSVPLKQNNKVLCTRQLSCPTKLGSNKLSTVQSLSSKLATDGEYRII